MSVVARMQTSELARPLHVLVPLIQQDIEEGNHAAETASMPHYRAAGDKLREAYDQQEWKKPDWDGWLKRNFNISISTAKRWMDYSQYEEDAEDSTEVRRRNFSSMTDFQRHVNPDVRSYQKDALPVRPQPWHHPIKTELEKIDIELLNIKAAELKRAEERKAQRTLALQLIDIGYKVLATKLHPDRGGSIQAMRRLNRVRDRLKAGA